MAHPMNSEELAAFLSFTPARTAVCCTVRADGRPHAAPIWYAVDPADGSLLFNTGDESVKGRNLLNDPRVVLCIDDEAPPYSFASIEGTAEIIADLAEVSRWAGRIGARYLGADKEAEMADRNGVPGELLIRVVPTKVVAVSGLAE